MQRDYGFGSSPGPPPSKHCRFCIKTFTKTEHLLRHERSHTKERPFRCKICAQSYGRRDTLYRHMKTHNKQNKENTLEDHVGVTGNGGLTNAAAALLQLQLSANCDALSPHAPGNGEDYTELDRFANGRQDEIPRNTQLEVDQNFGHASPPAQPVSNQEFEITQEAPSEEFPLDPNLQLWDVAVGSNYPTWHIGEDFDIQAFNSALLAPLFPEDLSKQVPTQNRLVQPTPNTQAGPCSPNEPPLLTIHDLWFTNSNESGARNDEVLYSVAPTHPMTPANSGTENNGLDDRYRYDLSLRLQPRWREDPLPSTEFLNLALQLFFTKFNPIFPLIHAPTFRPSQQNSLLLLSICSIGSLFMGSNGATAQGSKIFERLNKVILASWETILPRKTRESISLIQAATIGQTFGYLSGNPKHLDTVEAFSGTVIAWARRSGFFSASKPLLLGTDSSPQELTDTWKRWAESEEMRRTALGLYVHDSQLARMFHHDPLLRHSAIHIQAAASAEIFNAPNAMAWASMIRASNCDRHSLYQYQQILGEAPSPSNQPSPRASKFSSYVLLHGIAAAIQETWRAENMKPSELCRHRDTLTHWYHTYGAVNCQGESDPFCLMILWHESFMSLLVDFDKLERAIGRDGPDDATQVSSYVEQWASSIHAKRVVIHASLIHQQFGNVRVASEPAIHVPRSMFLAAIAWYCYIKFGIVDSPAVTTEEVLDFPEVKILNINSFQHLFEASGFTKGKPTAMEASPLCGLTDMLQHIGHWDIARRFARILGSLIHADTDGHLVDGV